MTGWFAHYFPFLCSDDVFYIISLLITAVLGPVFRCLPSALQRRWAGSLLGLLLMILLCRGDVVHPVTCAVGNAVLLKLVSPRYLHCASFVWSFGYLAMIRCVDAFVRPVSPLVNIIQMMSALRLVGIAFEVHTSWQLNQSPPAAGQLSQSPPTAALLSQSPPAAGGDVAPNNVPARRAWATVAPSAADLLHYFFFYVGVVTGPYFTYATYRYSISGTFWRWADCWGPAKRRARLLPLYAGLFFLLGYLWPIEYVHTPEMAARSLLYRLCYIYPVFARFRMRMYVGFILSEVACITHGVGAYPAEAENRPGAGPTKHETAIQIQSDRSRLAAAQYDFETVHNIRELRVELDTSMTTVLKQWNTTVQYWLYTVVYRGTPGSKLVRATATMLVSAFWHGIQSGYYLSLLSCPPYMVVEDVWNRLLRKRLSPEGVRVYDCVSWFLRVSMFSYLSMGFLLLDARTTLQYWGSVYHLGHLAPLGMFVLGVGLSRLVPRRREGEASKQKVHAE